MPPPTAPLACLRLAEDQSGVISQEQVLAAGMSRSWIGRRVAHGLWQRLYPKVYVVSSGEPTWRQKVRGASLWAPPGAALSHETAAALWRLEGFAAGPVVISAPQRLRAPEGLTAHRTWGFGPADIEVMDGMRVTSPARTLLDLASGNAIDRLEVALDHAIYRGLVSPAKMDWFLGNSSGKGRRGTAKLRRLLRDRPPGYTPPHSPLEGRLWRLLLEAGLPKPVKQHTIREGGRFVARVDLAYPAEKVALEADGYRWHCGKQAWLNDLRRRNHLTSLGWRVVHVTHWDLKERPDRIINQVRSLLAESRLFALSEARLSR